MRVILEKVSDETFISCEHLRNRFCIEASDDDIKQVLDIAIRDLELERGISLRAKTWTVVHNNCYINLDRGPVQRIISMKDSRKKDIKPISMSRTHDNMMLKFSESCGEITVVYEAGYNENNLPACLKKTICDKFYSLYLENRGLDEVGSYNHYGPSMEDRYFMKARVNA